VCVRGQLGRVKLFPLLASYASRPKLSAQSLGRGVNKDSTRGSLKSGRAQTKGLIMRARVDVFPQEIEILMKMWWTLEVSEWAYMRARIWHYSFQINCSSLIPPVWENRTGVCWVYLKGWLGWSGRGDYSSGAWIHALSLLPRIPTIFLTNFFAAEPNCLLLVFSLFRCF
jgi:hypothetical protein